MNETTKGQGNRGRGKRKVSLGRLLPVVILIGGLALALSLGWHRYLSLHALHEHREELVGFVESYGLVAGLAYMALYAVATAFSVPGGLFLTLGAGFLFGVFQACVVVIFGATIGATALFLAARTALGDLLRARAGPFLQKMEAGFKENELSYLLVLRLIPLFPFWLVNIVPAFLGVSLRTYVIGTFFGIIPGAFVYASVGARLGDILDTYDPENPPELAAIIFEPANIIPIAGLVILSLLPVVYKKMKRQKQA